MGSGNLGSDKKSAKCSHTYGGEGVLPRPHPHYHLEAREQVPFGQDPPTSQEDGDIRLRYPTRSFWLPLNKLTQPNNFNHGLTTAPACQPTARGRTRDTPSCHDCQVETTEH